MFRIHRHYKILYSNMLGGLRQFSTIWYSFRTPIKIWKCQNSSDAIKRTIFDMYIHILYYMWPLWTIKYEILFISHILWEKSVFLKENLLCWSSGKKCLNRNFFCYLVFSYFNTRHEFSNAIQIWVVLITRKA